MTRRWLAGDDQGCGIREISASCSSQHCYNSAEVGGWGSGQFYKRNHSAVTPSLPAESFQAQAHSSSFWGTSKVRLGEVHSQGCDS